MAYVESWTALRMDHIPLVDVGQPDALIEAGPDYVQIHTDYDLYVEVWGQNLDNNAGVVTDIEVTDFDDNLYLDMEGLHASVADPAQFDITSILKSALTGSDELYGSEDADAVYGFAGNDFIAGFGGNDVLRGDAGNDSIHGGGGNDIMIGGAGKDLLTGSGGLDRTLVLSLSESGTTFATRDVVNTFAHGDKIDLTTLDANTKAAGNQAFTFVSHFSHVAGQLQWDQTAPTGYLIQGDVNGDGAADFSLQIYAAPNFGTIHNWDFIL